MGENTATISGWFALVLIGATALVPIITRFRLGRRASPTSSPIRIHVIAGVLVALCAFIHSLFALLSLGSAGAISGGNLALFAGAGALMVLIAHVGIGLQLRDPKLKKRAQTRRRHIVTASTISALAVVHLVLLWSGGD